MKTIKTYEEFDLRRFNEGMNKLIKSGQILSEEEINDTIQMQKHNQAKFKDIFDEMKEIMDMKFSNESEKIGSIKTITLLRNYLINRKID